MNTERYNGWTNYETWNWALWLNNEYDSQRYWSETAQQIVDDMRKIDYEWQTKTEAVCHVLADELRSDCENAQIDLEHHIIGPFADILGVGLSRINWYEIAASIIDDCEQPDDDNEDNTTGELKK